VKLATYRHEEGTESRIGAVVDLDRGTFLLDLARAQAKLALAGPRVPADMLLLVARGDAGLDVAQQLSRRRSASSRMAVRLAWLAFRQRDLVLG